MRLLLSLLAFLAWDAVQAAPFTLEELELKKFAETMYSYDPAAFEYGKFDAHLHPRDSILAWRMQKHGPSRCFGRVTFDEIGWSVGRQVQNSVDFLAFFDRNVQNKVA